MGNYDVYVAMFLLLFRGKSFIKITFHSTSMPKSKYMLCPACVFALSVWVSTVGVRLSSGCPESHPAVGPSCVWAFPYNKGLGNVSGSDQICAIVLYTVPPLGFFLELQHHFYTCEIYVQRHGKDFDDYTCTFRETYFFYLMLPLAWHLQSFEQWWTKRLQ